MILRARALPGESETSVFDESAVIDHSLSPSVAVSTAAAVAPRRKRRREGVASSTASASVPLQTPPAVSSATPVGAPARARGAR
jgi:hypothetical protein